MGHESQTIFYHRDHRDSQKKQPQPIHYACPPVAGNARMTRKGNRAGLAPRLKRIQTNSETRTTLSSLQRFQSASLVTRRLAPQARATANWMASGVLNP